MILHCTLFYSQPITFISNEPCCCPAPIFPVASYFFFHRSHSQINIVKNRHVSWNSYSLLICSFLYYLANMEAIRKLLISHKQTRETRMRKSLSCCLFLWLSHIAIIIEYPLKSSSYNRYLY